MSNPIVFFVAGTPVPQGSKSLGKTRDGRTFMRESGSERLRPWRKAIQGAALVAMRHQPPMAGPVAVVLTFAMRWPASHHGRATWPTGRPDVDKLTRAALDGITGTVIHDDSQVVSVTARKVWAQHDVEWPEGLHVWCNYATGFTPTAPS